MNKNPLLKGLDIGRKADPFVIYIFGVTGDLTRKKLMPGLFSLFLKERIRNFKIVGFARRPWSDVFFRKKAEEMIADFSGVDDKVKNNFLRKLSYIQSSFESDEGYEDLDKHAEGIKNRLYYLATPPNSYRDIIKQLGRFGLSSEKEGFSRIVVEKPFGRDLPSAEDLNNLLFTCFREEQIYRIDHYLGKETVQNIMLLRFGNEIFEPFWNNRYVDHIQITVAEKEGVGTRGSYYEKAGTLRDMIQNHMFQLLSLTAMEPPNDFSAESIRSEKVKIIRSLSPITPEEVDNYTVRGQYGGGTIDGQTIPGYLEEGGVDPGSKTETFVALKVFLDTWRWAGVPIYLRSGKRLTRKMTEISLHFKEPPLQLFRPSHTGMNRNTLIIRIQPEEGMTLNINAKVPGYQNQMRPVNMDFSYGSAFGDARPEAYERLLLDALVGDSTLYTRKDEIEASWAFISRILQGFEKSDQKPYQYLPGSSGPEEASNLFSGENRRWRKV